jgi:D-arabinose 1-dehydrogenase-like Zn-dependent alcohol dehydrogenase
VKALFVKTPGEEPELDLREVDTPSPVADQVLVRVASAGLCSHDVAIMRGVLRRGVDPDVVLGHEIAGTVEETGPDVTGLRAGDAVVSTLTVFCGVCERCVDGREYRCYQGQGIGHAVNGGFAEFVALPERCLVKLPSGLTPETASILACPMGVALQALRDVARVKPDDVVLVTGAGGGLGVHALQLATVLGARAMAATSSPEKLEELEGYAPGDVVLGGELDFSEIVLALTEDRGADVVIETVGSATFASSLRSLAQFGRLVVLGEVEGDRVSFNLAEVIFRDAAVLGSSGASKAHIAEVVRLVAEGAVKPVISHRVPLAEALDGYRLVRQRRSLGRVVLVP